MNSQSANLISAASIAALIGYVVYHYSGLPDPMPTHWDSLGNANGFMSRLGGVAALIAVPIFSVILFKIIPLISPRGFRTDQFTGVVNSLMVGFVVFGCIIAVVALQTALGADINISKIVLICVALLLIFVGNFMGKVRKNFFIGIRTPWTLASDEVWIKTHRLGGWCMVLAGILMATMATIGVNAEYTVLVVVAMVLVPVVYSYFEYRALEGFEGETETDGDIDSDK